MLLVGSKIDLISGDREETLARIRCSSTFHQNFEISTFHLEALCVSLRADMLALVRFCLKDEVRFTEKDIMFVSSVSSFPG